ncbi:MFS transporter [Paracraurococcus lichenis]|uniref:MFS transporter n=1 Tax=Paracraurococcus lichenis TaxID=3064888 RepID=A0ABT9DTR7_9PROT|nr:MFS transporter [Paracraurococcus sp. LOR1-02]MDO9707279.1 MFS transporter [Paracraurococcus sp. LOR1-02]
MEGTTRLAAEAPPRPFALPDFRRLWAVGLVVFIVRWLEMLAVSIFVWQATHSAFLVTMMGMLRILPMGLFGAPLGVLAERVEARTSLVIVVLASLVTSAALAALSFAGALAVWHLALASFVNGIAWAADNPVRRMMIGQVVGPERMGQAMSFDVGSNNASRMLGPTVSGLLFAAVGIEGTFVVSVLLYGGALLAAVTLRYRSGRAAAGGEGVLARIGEGLRAVRQSPRLRGTLVVTILFNIFGWPFTALVPVVAQDRFALGPEATGLLASMDGVGAFAGALLMAWLARPRWYARAYVGGLALYLAMVSGFALAPGPVAAGAALLLVGFGQSGFSIMQATLVYLLSPPEVRTRVLGLLSVCIGIGPVGFLAMGLLADRLGATATCAITGIAGLLALALTAPLWRAILALGEDTKT